MSLRRRLWPWRRGADGAAVDDAVWSCVLDDTPAIWRSFTPWLATLTGLAGAPGRSIVVHHVCDLPDGTAGLLRRLEVRTERVAPFAEGHPHTNKIAQCGTDFGDARRVVLTDVDVVFTRPLPLDRIGAPVAGKPTDYQNPPLVTLCEVLNLINVPVPAARWRGDYVDKAGTAQRFETLPGHCNGGFYALDRAIVPDLGRAWAAATRQLIAAGALDRGYRTHYDQVGFCAAVQALGLKARQLGQAWNQPTHIPAPPVDEAPFVLHHHARLGDDLMLLPPVTPVPGDGLQRVNRAIAQFRAEHGV